MQAAGAPVYAMPPCNVAPLVGVAEGGAGSTDVLEIVEIIADGAGRLRRTADAAGMRRYLLILQLEGRSDVQQSRAKVSLNADDLLLLDTRIPARITASAGSRQLVVSFRDPPVSTQAAGRPPPAIGAIRGAGELAVGLRCLVLAMRDVVANLTPQEQWGLRTALFQLALAALNAETAPDGDGVPRRSAAIGLPASLRESIESRLSDPGLCPARIAAAHGISTRQLHRLFKQTGTPFGAFVRRRRLERCRDDLADPRLRPLPMTEIAFRWGFSDSAHFSRCFRATFGCTAREFRAGCFPLDRTSRRD